MPFPHVMGLGRCTVMKMGMRRLGMPRQTDPLW